EWALLLLSCFPASDVSTFGAGDGACRPIPTVPASAELVLPCRLVSCRPVCWPRAWRSLVSAPATGSRCPSQGGGTRAEAASRSGRDGECDWRCVLHHRRHPSRDRRAPVRRSPIPYPARPSGGRRVRPTFHFRSAGLLR